MFVRITNHPRDARQRRQFFRRPLRVAAGHQNLAIRIHPLQPPYGGTRIFVRALGHGAGIQHHNFGVAGRPGALQSAIQKLPLQGSPIRLCRAAAKILYVETSHTSILNEWGAAAERFAEKLENSILF